MLNLKALGITGAAAFLLGSGAGWKAKSVDVKAKSADALTAQRAAHTEALTAFQTELDAANADRLSLANELSAEKENVKIKYVKIKNKVPDYAPKNTDVCNCNLSPDFSSLLNSAASGSFTRSEGSDIATRLVPSALPKQSGELAGGQGGKTD